MTVSLSSVTPIPADASEEIKLWIMQLAEEVSAELNNADREIITQVKVGEDRDLGEIRLKLSLSISASGADAAEDEPKRRGRRTRAKPWAACPRQLRAPDRAGCAYCGRLAQPRTGRHDPRDEPRAAAPGR